MAWATASLDVWVMGRVVGGPGELDPGREVGEGFGPEAVEIGAYRVDAGGVDLVEASPADRLVQHQPGVLEHLEVLGDGGTADRETRRQLADDTRAVGQAFEDGPAGGIAECSRRVGRPSRRPERANHHW